MTTNRKVLVITNKEDVTVDYVIRELQRMEVPYYRFNTEDVGYGIDLIFDGNEYKLFDKIKKIDMSFKEFGSVYYRRPKIPRLSDDLSVGEKQFILNEFETYFEGLYRSLSDKYWLNWVLDMRVLENKMFQVTLAKEMGFLVPRLHISSAPEKSLEFINSLGKTVFKPLKMGFIDEPLRKGKLLYTTRVDSDFVNAIELNQGIPIYIQEEIEKECDIRVTVVGNNVYAARILSQESDESRVDWRKSESMLKHESFDLPLELEEKCKKLCQNFNLDFSAIDFILDKKGRYWFLEINCNGQWAWIEALLGYPISKEIVKMLSQGVGKNVQDHRSCVAKNGRQSLKVR